MNTAFFDDTEVAAPRGIAKQLEANGHGVERHVTGAEFRQLAVSHRHMIRVDMPGAGLRGLRDLQTGEIFLPMPID